MRIPPSSTTGSTNTPKCALVVSDGNKKAIDKLLGASEKELGIIKDYPPTASMVWKDALKQ